jgi:hypothetical protein
MTIFSGKPNKETITPQDVQTDGKFDASKFNNVYNEVKKKKQEQAMKIEQERLANYKEDKQSDILDVKVYDLLVDYSDNVYGIASDVVAGRPWMHNNRLLYLGITMVLISVVYFTLNNI